MAYQPSNVGKKVLNKYLSKGKLNALTPPSYLPPLQKPVEYLTYIVALLSIPAYQWWGGWGTTWCLVLAAILFGINDVFIQDDHTITRIYGPFGRLRYLFENVFRDKYLQYFNETNTDGRPIPKIVRDYIYQKAKGYKSMSSFGTELDIYDSENTTYARILHRNFPGTPPETSYGFEIGEKRSGVKPFKVISTINVSAMSYGALNYKACETVSLGAKEIAFVNTGEGGFGPHGIAGNDCVWQLGTGKFGAGKDATLSNGDTSRVLDEQLLVDTIKKHDNIKMIELKISQGAKPSLGGHLPGSKVTEPIADVRKVPVGKTVISPPQQAELIAATPKESVAKLMDFCKKIRELTELPVGIKLCVGQLAEMDLLVEAMKVTGEGPDAIQVDGSDGGTGAAPNLYLNYVGYGGAIETIALLDKKFKNAGIRDKVILNASGRLFTPAHAALAFAYGADTIETARAIMLSIGCIQALKCHTNECPTGITTNNAWRMHGINIPEKATRVHSYLSGFHHDMMGLTKSLGHNDPRDITREDVRVITDKVHFASFFEEDPFGVFLPTPQKMQEDAVNS
ncbi:MAG: FMN-binding glutamate synthase family protein [Bacteroidia bacterium]|nr:FMN-binding glutamate synthase family protein [Bacteroidia bacterium]